MIAPAEEMWADILTKPLQGLAFRTMRAVLINCPINYEDEEETEVIRSRTNTSNTPVPPKKTVKWENNLKTHQKSNHVPYYLFIMIIHLGNMYYGVTDTFLT